MFMAGVSGPSALVGALSAGVWSWALLAAGADGLKRLGSVGLSLLAASFGECGYIRRGMCPTVRRCVHEQGVGGCRLRGVRVGCVVVHVEVM